jgi:hypothetical protein
MNVITSKPVIIQGANGYSNADALPFYTSPSAPALTNAPSNQAIADSTRAERVKAGLDKAKGIYQKGQESGIFQSLGNLLGLGKKDVPAVAPASAPMTAPEPKDNTMKYVLIGGGVLAVGVIVYLATRKK